MLTAGKGSSVAGRSVGTANQPRNVRPNAPPLVVAPLSANPPPHEYVPPPENIRCITVSRREFHLIKALFGHMNSHPNRGWKGAYDPPPVQEEVAGNAGNPVEEKVPPDRRNVLPNLGLH
ncbi:hypothetical protein A4A49_19450 [Nicotiana attenuata]|uniref:Uncharacterized protein n=1 Tax=Nicotiana attenuata TaxID=49451 RepID=A0A314KR09_NICAT|nr:hypothetical protein A4A49_19450 [Nicotiana attenuata]